MEFFVFKDTNNKLLIIKEDFNGLIAQPKFNGVDGSIYYTNWNVIDELQRDGILIYLDRYRSYDEGTIPDAVFEVFEYEYIN